MLLTTGGRFGSFPLLFCSPAALFPSCVVDDVFVEIVSIVGVLTVDDIDIVSVEGVVSQIDADVDGRAAVVLTDTVEDEEAVDEGMAADVVGSGVAAC